MEEAQEEVLMINSSNKDQQSHNNNIVKGKRTKRQRPQSPVPFVVNGTIHDNTNLSSSPAVSSAEEFFDSTEEDEDMANCLILLAQCQSTRESPPKPKPAHYDVHEQEEIAQLQINNNVNNSGMKFNSRRFLEAPGTGTGTGKGGCYVYECKTCNRTFPSFQALGGHRASHKKPKAMLMNDDRLSLKSQHQQQQQQQFLVSKSDDEEEGGNFRNVSSLSLQLSNNNRGHNNNNNSSFYSGNINNGVVKGNSSKVHECSICGAEFTSGQALGGHMRRHRSAPVAATAAAMAMTNTTLSLTPMAVVEAGQDQPRKSSSSSSSSRNNLLSLDLDLNLPAPEDDPKESKLPFSSKQQQQQQQQQQPQQQQKSSLVFTAAAALVDCHY